MGGYSSFTRHLNKMKIINYIKKIKKGFTLIEFVVAIGIFSIVVIFTAIIGHDLISFNSFINESLLIEQEIALTFRSMGPEFRSVGQSSIGSYPLEYTGTSSLIFYTDLGKDGVFERVRYFYSNNILKKGVVKPTGNPLVYATSTEIINDVVKNVVLTGTSTIFSYYGDSYTGSEPPLAHPIDISKVRGVKIELTVNQLSGNAGPVTISTFKTFRNLKAN